VFSGTERTACDLHHSDLEAELGGSGRLQELADQAWDDMDADDQRLLVLALIDSVFVDPDGETVAERVHASWRS
jgi:hypothetical protein